MEYSKLSKQITKTLDKNEKKNFGIFFTPPKTISKILDNLKPYYLSIKTILEPSFGSGEFITQLTGVLPNSTIYGVEYNDKIYENINKDTTFCNNENIYLINGDYLKVDFSKLNNGENFDLIIGNPPYFVMKKNDINQDYFPYFTGRPNIFIPFIIKSLYKLNSGGILAFVLPKSFLNCVYYDKTRHFINKNFKILNIINCDDEYLETKQETIIIIIQKKTLKENNNDFDCNEHNKPNIFEINGYTIFGETETISKFNELTIGATTLDKLGFNVNVGNVVWNQCKNILTDDKTKTLLIYSSDIVNNKLSIKKYSNPDKKNFIEKTGENGPLLVINRGYGVGKYKFTYLLIEGGFDYLIENHLICIRYKNKINKDELINMYKKIISSLQNKKTTEFIELYFGNNAMNTTELCNILPLHGVE